MFAKNKFDKSSVTDIQSILTVQSIENGMNYNVSLFCSFTLSICFYLKVEGARYHISDRLTNIMLILKRKRRYLI